jgi:hypothetical protein
MSTHLGGFTSKSNKCHKDLLHKAQVLTKRIFHSTQTWISNKSHKPHQEMLGRAHKGLGMSIFIGSTSNL